MAYFYILDQGTYVPTTQLAQAYAALNFKNVNSLGIGTDTLTPLSNPDAPSWIVDIETQDLWGWDSRGAVYRNTSVGINSSIPGNPFEVYTADPLFASPNPTLAVAFNDRVGIGLSDPAYKLDVEGNLRVSSDGLVESNFNVQGDTELDLTLTVGGATELQDTLDVVGATNLQSTLDVVGETTLQDTLDVFGATTLQDTLDVVGATNLQSTLNVIDATSLQSTLDVLGATTLQSTLNVGGDAQFDLNVTIDGILTVNSNATSIDKDTGSIVTEGGVGIEENLNVGGNARIVGELELDSYLVDINDFRAETKRDWRLSAVGTGVSWRPSGVETQNTVWVTKDGDDANSGLLEGDAKATIGAAAAIAEPGDTIVIRPGVYVENNPIGLRYDVTVTGQDLRLVTVTPLNPNLDVFHVRRGCLIENINFAGTSITVNHTGCGAIAFPPIDPSKVANTGFIEVGPTLEGPSGRWRSPYIRNCTNFMSGSIGMRIDGDHASVTDPINNIGNNLKCMVCDSFTQYNENGIGVSITNNGYAQLVSIFTINSDIGIYADTGGSCDLTNSNSSFGNYGLYAVGLGITEYTSNVGRYPPSRTADGVDAASDVVTFKNISDIYNNVRRPYDGQAIFFEIDLTNYGDVNQSYVSGLPSSILTTPMLQIQEIVVTNGGSGFSPAAPPTVIIRDADDLTQDPKGPQGIIAELSPTIDEITGSIVEIDVVNSGRNYLPSQNLEVFIDGGAAVGASAEIITQPIYYTVDSATQPVPAVGRYADAISLIRRNIDFIATEAVDRMLFNNPSFTIPGGNDRCVEDTKLVLDAISYNLVYGGNDKAYDAGKIYIDNAYLAGEEAESIETFNNARDLAKSIINNVVVTKQSYTTINTFEQVLDLSIIADPVTGSNQDPASCADVQSSIDTLFAIVTDAIDLGTLPTRTSGTSVGITTVTFNEFIPYELFGNERVSFKRISRILTSSHSFEYIGTGVNINNSTPFQGAVPIKENEIVALDGAQVPFTSTDQKGNFDIGEGFQINQPTSTIRGRDFSKAIQAEVTPLILALR